MAENVSYLNSNVKISKKSLPDNCSRPARIQWLRSFFDTFTVAATAAVPALTKLESEPCLTLVA